MAGMWLAQAGEFKKLKRGWVCVNGVFQPIRDVDIALGGVMYDSAIGSDPVLRQFYATQSETPHVAVNVSWQVDVYEPDLAVDGVFVTWENSSKTAWGRSEVFHVMTGTASVYVGAPNTHWSFKLWGSFDGEEVYLGVIPDFATSDIPTPTNLQLAFTADPTVAQITWSRTQHVDGYTVDTYMNGGWTGVSWVGQPSDDTVTLMHGGIPANTEVAYSVRCAIGVNVSPVPATVSGRSAALYTAGWYEVPANQKRTLVRGDKKSPKRWRDASNTQLFHGHGGDWNDDGTQVGFIFYWQNNDTNPFAAVQEQLNKGGKCTQLQLRVNRSAVGYNVPIRPIVRTHVYKMWPGDGNLNGNCHENWHRARPAVNFNTQDWVDLDVSIVPTLINNNGNGIALGSTAGKKDDYMAFWKENTGKLRFKIE